jgi:hypothetical protein
MNGVICGPVGWGESSNQMFRTLSNPYCKLTIDAGVSDIEIWIGDDKGNFVQKGVGFLETSLLPGKYTVEFGLGNPKHC